VSRFQGSNFYIFIVPRVELPYTIYIHHEKRRHFPLKTHQRKTRMKKCHINSHNCINQKSLSKRFPANNCLNLTGMKFTRGLSFLQHVFSLSSKWFRIFAPQFSEAFRRSNAESYVSLTRTLIIHIIYIKKKVGLFAF
jgi:hypothetical protein